jgi:hypothetical protein
VITTTAPSTTVVPLTVKVENGLVLALAAEVSPERDVTTRAKIVSSEMRFEINT